MKLNLNGNKPSNDFNIENNGVNELDSFIGLGENGYPETESSQETQEIPGFKTVGQKSQPIQTQTQETGIPVDMNGGNKKSKKSKKKEENPQSEIEKKVRNYKLKKMFVLIMFVIIAISLLIFGTYNTFFKKEKTVREIAREVNISNKTTMFPSDGVLGYLQKNINEIIKDHIKVDNGINKHNIGDIRINKIAKLNAYLALVSFDAKVWSEKGDNRHNFIVPLYYDWETTKDYSLAGGIQYTISEKKDTIKSQKNAFLSFDGISKKDASIIESVSVFLQNFFVLVYNEKADYSQLYTGDKILKDSQVKFVKINSVDVYNGFNKLGFNCIVNYDVKLETEGITISNKTYIRIEPNNDSWVIRELL